MCGIVRKRRICKGQALLYRSKENLWRTRPSSIDQKPNCRDQALLYQSVEENGLLYRSQDNLYRKSRLFEAALFETTSFKAASHETASFKAAPFDAASFKLEGARK